MYLEHRPLGSVCRLSSSNTLTPKELISPISTTSRRPVVITLRFWQTLTVTTRPFIWRAHSIVTFDTGWLQRTVCMIERPLLIGHIHAIVLAIEKVLVRNAHPIHASILVIFTFIEFQFITVLLVEARHALLHTITNISPVQTQETEITFQSGIADNVPHIHQVP